MPQPMPTTIRALAKRRQPAPAISPTTAPVRLPVDAPQRLPVVVIARLRCPACRGVKLKTQSTRGSAGMPVRVTKCQADGCGHRFNVIVQ